MEKIPVILSGKVGKEPKQNGEHVSLVLVTERKWYENGQLKKEPTEITYTAYGKTAEYILKNVRKDMSITIKGHQQEGQLVAKQISIANTVKRKTPIVAQDVQPQQQKYEPVKEQNMTQVNEQPEHHDKGYRR